MSINGKRVYICEYCQTKQASPEGLWLCGACGAPLPGMDPEEGFPRGVLCLSGVSEEEFGDALRAAQKERSSISFAIGEKVLPTIRMNTNFSSSRWVTEDQVRKLSDQLQRDLEKMILDRLRSWKPRKAPKPSETCKPGKLW